MKKNKYGRGGSVLDTAPAGELIKEKSSERPFTKTNFWMMGGCLALIVIGFLLMSGGASPDPDRFNPEVFSTRRIVVGPLLAFLGFLFMAFAIIWTPGRRRAHGKEVEETGKNVGDGVA